MAGFDTATMEPQWSWITQSIICVLILVLLHQTARFIVFIRRFPGPLRAKLSSFWLVAQCRQTRRSNAVMALHGKYGDFVQIGPNHISINNPQAITQIYGHKTGFTKSEFYDAFLQVTPVVFNARNVATHARKKKFINPAFSARALSDFEPHMNTELLRWKCKLFSLLDDSKATLDFSVWTNYLAFDVIGSFAFGKSFGFVENAEDPSNLIQTINTRGEVLNALGAVPPSVRPLMKYHPFDSFWSSGLRATANLEKIGREAYNRRRVSDDGRKDLLSHLLTATDPDTKQKIQEKEIVAESISFIVGGSDTTSSTMTNFIDFVSRDPVLQSRLQEEIDVAFPGQPGQDWVPSDKQVSELPFLLAILREVMRFRPTSATGLERRTPKGGKIVVGRFIPDSTIVSVPTMGLMNDPRVFEEPESFLPSRWLAPDAGKLMAAFFPFSTGPRACIGRNFAWMEILKAMVIIFKLFEVKRLNKKPTVVREGFFNKAVECEVEIRKRDFE